MKVDSSRIATVSDAEAIANLVNLHELSVDPASSLMSEVGAMEFMAGYVDSSTTHLLNVNEKLGFEAIVNLHPDSVRKRFFADVYANPDVTNLDEVVSWAIELAESEHPDWDIWPGVNSLDIRLQSAWASQRFELLRRYYTMRLKISDFKELPMETNVEIRPINLSNTEQVRSWYRLQQDSFSNHFGFAPRDFENWSELILEDTFLDREGIFIAFNNGEAVGFCQCTDEYAEENKGFISLLGVIHQYRGLGIGDALLRSGIAHCAAKGLSTVELNVDTGNESGALSLYERLGFKAESSWIQMYRPGVIKSN